MTTISLVTESSEIVSKVKRTNQPFKYLETVKDLFSFILKTANDESSSVKLTLTKRI